MPTAPTRFLVVGPQRSGTTVTFSVLQQHPEVAAFEPEVGVTPLFSDGAGCFTFGNDSYGDRRVTFGRLFDALALAHATPETRACGLKVALSSPAEAIDIANSLEEFLPDVRVILVSRGDELAQFASGQHARRTGVWHRRDATDGADPTAELRLDAAELRSYATSNREILEHVRSLAANRPLLEIGYEKMIEPWCGLETMFEFLGVSPRAVGDAPMRKVAPAVEDFVADHESLRLALTAVASPDPSQQRAARRRRDLDRMRSASLAYVLGRAHELGLSGDTEHAVALIGIALGRDPTHAERMRAYHVLAAVSQTDGGANRVCDFVIDAERVDAAFQALLCAAFVDDSAGTHSARVVRLTAKTEPAHAVQFAWVLIQHASDAAAASIVTRIFDNHGSDLDVQTLCDGVGILTSIWDRSTPDTARLDQLRRVITEARTRFPEDVRVTEAASWIGLV